MQTVWTKGDVITLSETWLKHSIAGLTDLNRSFQAVLSLRPF